MKYMEKLTTNFSLNEFEKSATAKRYGISNTIPMSYMENVKKLANLMQQIRDEYKKPIIVDSGYRCPALNSIVKGSSSSDHLYAAACDFHSVTDTLEDNMKLWNLILKMRKEGKIEWRQLIFEYGVRNLGPNWLHISVNNPSNPYRNCQILYIGV